LKKDRYFVDLDTQERVLATYRVHLTMPSSYDGFIDITTTSEEEAARLALEADWCDVEWEDDGGDKHAITVLEVSCDDPPTDAVMITHGYYTGNANLESIFGKESQESQDADVK
jgi:hypothetical protein